MRAHVAQQQLKRKARKKQNNNNNNYYKYCIHICCITIAAYCKLNLAQGVLFFRHALPEFNNLSCLVLCALYTLYRRCHDISGSHASAGEIFVKQLQK